MDVKDIFISTFLLCSCAANVSDPCSAALERAGDNRSELESVIRHYSIVDPDTQKLKAACYLIGDMIDKRSVVPVSAKEYDDIFERLHAFRGRNGFLTTEGVALVDSAVNNLPGGYVVLSDLGNISADFLISNIDSAFEQWESALWAAEYSFDDFCRWVLPYRVSSEPLENWREVALSYHRPDEDSLKAAGDIWELGRLLINTTGLEYSENVSVPFSLSFSRMNMLGESTCGPLVLHAVQLLRSRGIPAAPEMIPAWGNRSSDHAWLTIINPDGSLTPIGYYGDNRPYVVENHRLPKVYLKSSFVRTEDPLFRYRQTEDIPQFFSGLDMADVTAKYDMPTVDVVIDGLNTGKSRIAWLCTFNNSAWVPVAYAEISDGKAIFKDMGNGQGFGHNAFRFDGGDLGIVYLPAYFVDGRVIPAANPVLVKDDGTVTELSADHNDRQSVTVRRKYPLFDTFCKDAVNMIGTRFEASDMADFSNKVTLLAVDSLQPHPLTRYKTASTDTGEKFRYVRYVFPDGLPGTDSLFGVSELRFFSSDTLLCGVTMFSSESTEFMGADNLFDGRLLTYCQAKYPEDTWVGLDLGYPRNITHIEYMPRTDDNDIWPGDIYEMLYWDGKWVSAGTKTAGDYTLTWDGMPSGTLYLVIDRTKGVENRIFTYRKGKQIWW